MLNKNKYSYVRVTEDRLQIRSNCVIGYAKWIGKPNRQLQEFRRLNMSLQRKIAYSGEITKGSQKRITKAVNLLIMTAKERWIFNEVTGRDQRHKLSFITLTISDNTQNLPAREAYEKLLRPFLQWMTKYKGVKTYIWKAELQKRGQIHYHITTHSFLNWKEIREKWNNLQSKAGLLEDFYNRFQHRNPNSTDVHEVYKKSDLTSYLIKYIAKADSKETKITGKCWDCSLNLKQAKYPDYEVNNEQDAYMSALVAQNYLAVKQCPNCAVFSLKGCAGAEILSSCFQEAYYEEIQAITSSP